MQRTTTTATGAPTIGELVDGLGPSPVLLAVWAHPDDESFLGAGLVAEVARRGGRVETVCATLGEHGTDDPDAFPPAELAEIRRRELDEALAELGCRPAHLLGFGDGACELVPTVRGEASVGRFVDDVRPDVVLSFGPDGVTGHPDHRAVASWVRRAVGARGDRIPCFQTAAGATWPGDCVERLHTIESFWPGYPDRNREAHVEVHLDGWHLVTKTSAMDRHRSQIGPVREALGDERFSRLAAAEGYRAANGAAFRTIDARPVPVAA